MRTKVMHLSPIPVASSPARKCHACGTGYSEDAWSDIVLVETLEPQVVSQNLRGWPGNLCIEVRVGVGGA
jgi:hypothetical protein